MVLYSFIYHTPYNTFWPVTAAIITLAEDGCNYRTKNVIVNVMNT